MKPAKEQIEVNLEELAALVERARQGPLSEEDCERLEDAIQALSVLIERIGEKNTTISQLRALLSKTSKVLEQAGVKVPAQNPPPLRVQDPPKPGHGRNGAQAYRGADRIKIPHGSLKSGDHCPECLKGKVYLQKDPGLRIRVVGQAPMAARVYELERLRCSLCGEVYEAEAPPEVGEKKYDASAAAMIALLKYGSGVPWDRLERLEASLGIPLPASTQCEIVAEVAEANRPVFEELIRQAAQGEVFYNDDTSMKILALARASPPRWEEEEASSSSKERTGLFTSGIVSTTRQGQRIALFFSGRNHAGENLARVFVERAKGLTPPIQKSDALSRNVPKLPEELEILWGNCNAHARRRFVQVTPNFPEECRFVLESFRDVYGYEAEAQRQGLVPEERLRFHQEHSQPVMDALHTWFEAQFVEKKVEPNSGLGEAITYCLKRWTRLTLFLRRAGAPLDSNLVERALKKAILHRKNSPFYKTENGAEVGDRFMSLIHTCELNDVNPFDYLTELQKHAEELAKNPAAWMPWNYRQTLQQADTSQDPAWPLPGVEYFPLGRKPSSSARPERQSKMGEKRVSRTAKLRKVFGHPPHRAKTPFRAGLYARVSTQDQQTIPMQTRALREYATRRGWTLALQVKEIGSGGSQRERREQLLEAARRREIDVVLVWRLDRWGRSVTDLLATLQELEHLGVGFVSLTEALDLTTPAGRAMAGLLAVCAEFEREIRRERVRAGLAHARQNGQRLGRPATAGLHADKIRKLYRAGTSKS